MIMKKIKEFIADYIGVFIVVIGVIVMPIFIVVVISYRIGEAENEMRVGESHIGEEYILRGDTMQIIDYCYFCSTYTLSNGVKINEKLVLDK